MLMLISPAKKQDYDFEPSFKEYSSPIFLKETKSIVKLLKNYSSPDLQKLMSISQKLGDLNFGRYQTFNLNNAEVETARPAAYAFRGDVYQKLRARDFTNAEAKYMQKHLMILSGLYGCLRPLDLIQPHRLEMGAGLSVGKNKNLYEFWDGKIAEALNQAIANDKHKAVINLASKEYYQSINFEALAVPVWHIEFKEQRGDTYKVFGMSAKRARGMMARFIIENKINTIDELKKFNLVNYKFNESLSSGNMLCFARPE